MYKKWKKYKRYRPHSGYRSHYNRNEPGLLDMAVEAIIGLLFLLGKFFFKLIRKAFQRGSGMSGSFKINEVPIYTQASEAPIESEEIARIKEVFAHDPVPETPMENEKVVNQRYGLKQSLLTPAEKNFLSALEQVVGNRYRIENQVQLSGIVIPLDSNEHFTNYRDFNKIKAKSIDFVLYDVSYKPYLCIELDDRSHLQWDRMKRDAFVDEVMKSANLRIIHIRTAYSYDLEDLNKKVFRNSTQSN